MSKSIRAIFVLMLILNGCAPVKEDPKEEEVIFADPMGQDVTSPTTVSYVWNNPIVIKNIQVTESSIINASVIEIDGLKDNTVETKINNAIKTRFDTLMSYQNFDLLPPFRGLRQRLKEGATLNNFNVYVSMAYNANYVLSVTFNVYAGITNPDDSYVYVNVTDGMTFELIQGNQLNLSDLFTNDADIGTLINTSFDQALAAMNSQDEVQDGYYWYGHLIQIKPFSGIKADQPFFISDQGLHLIVDYRSPDFETNLSSSTVTVPFVDFLGFIGITERFVSTTEIFDSAIIDRQFLLLGSTKNTLKIDPIGNSEVYKFRSIYPNDLDQAMVDLLNQMKENTITTLSAYIASHTVDYLSGTVSAQHIGPYVCLYSGGEAYADPDFMFVDEANCYDRNHHLMSLSDYFKPGFDYESALKAIIHQEISLGYLPQDISVDEVYSKLKIRLMSTGLYISAKAYSASLGQDQYFGVNPQFSRFGINNLSIFD